MVYVPDSRPSGKSLPDKATSTTTKLVSKTPHLPTNGKTWDLLDRSSSTRDLHSLTLKVGLRRPNNLRDILVKAKLKTPGDETDQNKKGLDLTCITHLCRYCTKLNKTGKITSKVTGRKYYAPTKAKCNSNNIVYCILCLTSGNNM